MSVEGFTCPKCGRTSHHRDDVRHGYCGRCHAFTRRSDDVLHDPDFVEWAEDRRAHLMPMIQESALVVSLIPQGPADMKFAVELGLSIMLDKPIVAVVRPGQIIAGKLRAVAEHIVEWEPGQGDETLQELLGRLLPHDDEDEAAP